MKRLQISLAAARVNAKMTQDEVAKKIRKSKQTIVNWENGKTAISLSDARKLAKLYKLELHDIFFE